MKIEEARQVAALIPEERHAELTAARERYMYFTGVFTDTPAINYIEADRETFAHLLVYTEDGRPSLSDDRCAEFMSSVTGMPRQWCLAWDEIAFIAEHGDGLLQNSPITATA